MVEKLNAVSQHLLADRYGIALERLADGETSSDLLQATAERSGLRAITAPTVIPFKAARPGGQAGVTGFIVLAKSHVAFHSCPEPGFMVMDMSACGPNAQPQAALDIFVEQLEPEQRVIHYWMRGAMA